MLVIKEVVDIQTKTIDHLGPSEVAGGENQVFVLERINYQGLAAKPKVAQ